MEWIQAILICVCILCGVVMMACMLMMRQARKLTTVHREVQGRGEPCTFALLSDLHVGIMPVSWGNIVDTLIDERPEFIILTGDLCNRLRETGRAACFIDLLVAKVRVPIYITFGNHDNEIFEDQPELRAVYIRELEALSPLVRVLESDFVIHEGVFVAGLNDVHSCGENVSSSVTEWGQMASSRELSFVLATHNPDMLLKLDKVPKDFRPHLTVCGHTHGGQIRAPFNFEFTVLRKDKLPKKGYFYGTYEYEGFPLYITSGLGCALLPIRFGSCAEVVIFHLS